MYPEIAAHNQYSTRIKIKITISMLQLQNNSTIFQSSENQITGKEPNAKILHLEYCYKIIRTINSEIIYKLHIILRTSDHKSGPL